MKEINGQNYGYSYELNSTSADDLTTCYAIDTGTVFVSFNGVWYEQPVKWAESSVEGGGGGAGMLIPVYTYDSDTETYSCDMTFEEIAAAIEAGKCVMAKMSSSSDTDYYYRVEQKYTFGDDGSGSGVRFSVTEMDEDGVYYTAIAHYISDGDEGIEYEDLQYPAGE